MSPEPERWQKVKALLGPALDLAPEERRGYLEGECDDPELRRQAESYLAAYLSESLRIEAPAGEGGFAADESADAMDLGEPIGPYRLLRRLGAGGMGEVFLAEQEGAIRRTVALKLIRAGSSGLEVAARFAAERQTLARMSHPNIARVFDAGESRSGRPYVAMEYIEGATLGRYCDAHTLGLKERLELFVAVCRGVQHAHQKGGIHRDLKPGNILMAIEDGQGVPKIIDFGVAKAVALGADEAALLTAEGQWIGTPDYMSPEQAGGAEGAVDTRSDVYWSLVRALRAERGAREQTRRAQEEEAKAKAVTTFLLEVLDSADPEVSLRPETTVREALDRAAARIPARLAGQPLVQAKVLVYLGDAYQGLGQFEKAKSLLKRSLQIRRRHAGDSDLQVALVSQDLAQVYIDLADYSQARKLLKNALTIETRQLELDDPRLASTLNVLGTALKKSGEPQRARKCFERALAIFERRSRVDPVKVAMVLDNLGLLFAEMGENARAQNLLERALTLHEQALGSRHPALAFSLNNLAMAVANLGDTAKARALFSQAVEIDRATYGPGHPNVAIGKVNLAELARNEGDCRTAVALYDEGRAILGRHYAPDHPTLLEVVRLLEGARACLAASSR